MHCVAITSVRGGTGKSTLAINLAARLALHGHTLLIDLDGKSDCATGLAVPHDAIRAGSQEILNGGAERRQLRREALAWPVQKRLDLVPALPGGRPDDATAQPQAQATSGRILDWLDRCGRQYDYVVLDVPWGNECAVRAAMEIATLVLVPAVPDFQSLVGTQRDLQAIRSVVRDAGRDIPVRAVGNMHDVRSRFSREMVLGFRQRLGDDYLQTVIHGSVKVREAASFGQPISVYDRNCPASLEFGALADEILDRRTGMVTDEEAAIVSANPRLKLVDISCGQVAIPIPGMSRRPGGLVPHRPPRRIDEAKPIRLATRSLQLVHDSAD